MPRALSNNAQAMNRRFEAPTFKELVERDGWRIARQAGGNPMYEVVQLVKQ
ncbi:MAG: hypothetical protein QM765_39815 [Myxococcales bacterium]